MKSKSFTLVGNKNISTSIQFSEDYEAEYIAAHFRFAYIMCQSSSNCTTIQNIISTTPFTYSSFIDDLKYEIEDYGIGYLYYEIDFTSSTEIKSISTLYKYGVILVCSDIEDANLGSFTYTLDGDPANLNQKNASQLRGGIATCFRTLMITAYKCSFTLEGVTLGAATPEPEIITITNNLENCESNTNSIEVNGNSYEIILTANDGYEFTVIPTITIGINTTAFEVASNKQTASITITPQSGDVITVNAAASELPTYTEITTNLTHCTIDTNTLQNGVNTMVTLTADDGYYFQRNDDLELTGVTGTINGKAITFLEQTKIEDNKYKNAYTTIKATAYDTIIINAEALSLVIPPQNIAIDYSNISTNCTGSPASVTEGEQSTITLTASEGYIFANVPTLSIDGVTMAFTLNEEKNIAQVTFIPTAGEKLTVYADTVEYEEPLTAPITYESIVNCKVTAAGSDTAPSVYTEGTALTLVFTANENCIFDGMPYVEINFYGVNEQESVTKISDTEWQYTFPTTPFTRKEGNTVRILATASPVTQAKEKYGLIQIYKPTSENLEDIGRKRFVNIGTDEYYDLGQYITSLKRIFLNVETSETNNVILGKNDTGVICPIVDDDDVVMSLGQYEIKGYYGNALDINESEIKVTLPFIGVESLDVDYCMNSTIELEYRANLISGECLCNVYKVNDDIKTLVQTFNGDIGFDVPYILNGSMNNLYNQDTNSANIFNVKPSIEIWQALKADDNDDVYTTHLVEAIGNIESGFVKISQIYSIGSESENTMLASEYEMIERQLQDGIYI